MPPPKAPIADIYITFKPKAFPTGVIGLPGFKDHKPATRYESDVTVSGGLSGTFKGTIFPDNMNVKGHIFGGMFKMTLGFHGAGTPKASDLVVRTNGFRPVIVINDGLPVPVVSNLATKTTADGIHIHNGWGGWVAGTPMSEGCMMIYPDHWEKFLGLFLKAFPLLSDWSNRGTRFGRRIGTLVVAGVG